MRNAIVGLVPYEARLQTIEHNRMEGPGLLSEVTNLSGIDADWACGGTNRTVTISGNYIDKWPQSAVHFDQSFDLAFGCNGIDSSDVGVDYARTGLVSSPAVRLRRNGLIVANGADAGVRSTEASTLDLGPNDTYTGQNVLSLVDLVAPFVVENDPDSLYLDARYDYWYRSDTLQTVLADIEARIDTDLDSAQVDVSSFYTSDPTAVCYPDSNLAVGCPGAGLDRLRGECAERERRASERVDPPIRNGARPSDAEPIWSCDAPAIHRGYECNRSISNRRLQCRRPASAHARGWLPQRRAPRGAVERRLGVGALGCARSLFRSNDRSRL